MRKAIPWVLLVVAAVAAAWYWSVRRDVQEVQQVEVLSPPVMAESEPIRYPVEEIIVAPVEPELVQSEPEPLPPFEESDAVLHDEIAALVDEQTLGQYLMLDLVVSRIVATIDSMDSSKVAPLMLPVRPPGGKYLVLKAGDEAVASPENAFRYQPYVDMLAGLDIARITSLYTQYYPWFQQAWVDQGYPDGYFNDRLVDVLDLLLETPRLTGMPELVAKEAVYEYSDPRLESLAAGQKMLLRLNADQREVVEAKLRTLRDVVSGMPLPAEEPVPAT